jgi:hypothetical protein
LYFFLLFLFFRVCSNVGNVLPHFPFFFCSF